MTKHCILKLKIGKNKRELMTSTETHVDYAMISPFILGNKPEQWCKTLESNNTYGSGNFRHSFDNVEIVILVKTLKFFNVISPKP